MKYLVNFFKLVSDETRFRIIMLLSKEDLCVCQMCGIMNESQPKVSKHLGKLRDLGYVVCEQRKKYIYYSLNITDESINLFIKEVFNNIDKYPTLLKDNEDIVNKEKYSDSCCS